MGMDEILDEVQELLEGISESGFYQFPVKMQLENLGLTQSELKGLEGKKLLDACCGREAKLVEELRSRGLDAYGMDPCLQISKPYLEKRGVGVSYDGTGSILGGNDKYSRVFTHGFNQLFAPFSGIVGLEKEQWGGKVGASVILMELLRVTEAGGKIVCYPSICELNENSLGFEGNYKIKTEKLLTEFGRFARKLAREHDSKEISSMVNAIGSRTVITKD